MQKFIRKISVFILPIILFLTSYEIIVRHIENDYSYKNNWLESNCEDIELLAIGSSYCLWGLNPELFSAYSFNAAHVGQNIKYDYLIINKFFEKMDSLKYLIITLSYGEPYNGISRKYKSLLKNYVLYYHFPAEYLLCNFECLFGIKPEIVWNRMLGKPFSTRNCSSLGFEPMFSVNENWKNEINAEVKKKSLTKLYGHTFRQATNISNNNMSYMKEIINMCNKRNIKVIIVSTPFHQLFRSKINRDQWALNMDFCNKLAKEYDNVSYINMFEDSRFNDEDFFDGDHLNMAGASKLTSIINEYIESQIAQ